MSASGDDEIGFVLLAAGESQRMATSSKLTSPKALLPWFGRPLIQYQLEQLAAVAPAHIALVTGFHAERLAPYVNTVAGVHTVQNPDPARGRSSSIVLGVQSLPNTLSALP